MNGVRHPVRGEGSLEFIDQLLVAGHAFILQKTGATAESVEMFLQFEDSSVVESKAFPNSIAILDRGVERADAGLVSMGELSVDVDDEIGVGGIVSLQHGLVFPIESFVNG